MEIAEAFIRLLLIKLASPLLKRPLAQRTPILLLILRHARIISPLNSLISPFNLFITAFAQLSSTALYDATGALREAAAAGKVQVEEDLLQLVEHL